MYVKKLTWEIFKQQVDTFNLNIQCLDVKPDQYELFAYYNKFTLTCRILKTDPKNADQLDWENNYQNISNQKLKQTVIAEPSNISITLYKAADVVEILAQQEMNIDIELIQENAELQQILYGGALYASDPGFEDYVQFQVIDKNNILGYGTNTILKEYIDKAYLNNQNTFEDYDDAGAYLPVGLFLRCIYHCTKATGSTKVKLHYVLGIPNE